MNQLYIDVILPLALPFNPTYRLPHEIGAQISVGCRVIVPLGANKSYTGVVERVHTDAPAAFEVKDVIAVVDDEPTVLPTQLRFWQWLSEYYLCTPGEVCTAALPAGLKKIQKKKHKPRLFDDFDQQLAQFSPLSLAQQRATDAIKDGFNHKNVCLLHGVTSSGKTEIYIHLMAEALRNGKQVLYLVPEIALTTQLTNRLKRVFGDQLGVYHSKITDAERVKVWQKQLGEDPYPIILGVRSSIFLPFQELGLVIVDEEHEQSYKQQDPAPRYNARNASLVLASYFGAKALLGTATPAIETYYNACQGRYGLVTLNERYQDVMLPDITPVDVAELRRKKRMKGIISPPLLEAISQALANHEQVILFQNRRGFAPMVECRTCGWIPKCRHCDVSLTYHKAMKQMTCHYCGYTEPVPQVCPACGETVLRQRGYGTEKVEDDIQTRFPEAVVARMDLDTTRSRTTYDQIIGDFQGGKTDILIGTQMVSKGLDFDHVSVVGILDADTMLSYPDFRSYERAYQLMAQVAGRAGRRLKQGKVWLQTRDIDHPIIPQVMHNDYAAMYQKELAERQAFRYPPFWRLIYVMLKHRKADVVDAAAMLMADKLRLVFNTRVLGPDKPAVGRVQSLYIKKIMVKIEIAASMKDARDRLILIQREMQQDDRFRSLIVYYDVDPM